MKKDKVRGELPDTIYYTDELNEEFSPMKIEARKIDENYDYGKSTFGWKLIRFFLYRIVALPIAAIFLKLKYRHKIVNRRALTKNNKGTGYFVFANHTNPVCDALIPTFVSFPRGVFVIVHPNNVSIPGLGNITHYLGALPLPDTLGATKNFMNIIKTRIGEHKAVMIYPEAHIWPFYTKIRHFSDLSFRYPVQHKVPSFCFTNTYQKRRFSKQPRIVTYVDGPFYPDEKLPAKEQKTELRDRIYNTMCERAKNSNYEIIKYIRKEND